MKIEFAVNPSAGILAAFSQQLGVPIINDRISLPSALGTGFIKKIDIEQFFKIVIHHYTLHQDFYLKRLPLPGPSDMISIVFNSYETPISSPDNSTDILPFFKRNGSSIQISSSILGKETIFSKNSNVRFVAIGIKASVLAAILKIEKPNSLVQKILSGKTTFFFHEHISVDEQRIVKQFSKIDELEELNNFHYRIKAEELLYLLFSKLLARGNPRQSVINKSDIEAMYTIRTAILSDLSNPPKLQELAKMSGIGEGKMKQLFKQIFGDTIYNYYQKERMQEAAFLIRQSGLTVSEAGYQIGFSNLSHFGRLFEKHFGMTPKKYSYINSASS
jgi:AraC-like DNA-binding protein